MGVSRQKKALPDGLVEAIARRRSGMDSSALLSAITTAWGGPDNLAADIRSAYQSAEPGSTVRVRTLEMIQRLVINNTDKQLNNVRPPSEMSDDELKASLQSYLTRMSEAADGVEA